MSETLLVLSQIWFHKSLSLLWRVDKSLPKIGHFLFSTVKSCLPCCFNRGKNWDDTLDNSRSHSFVQVQKKKDSSVDSYFDSGKTTKGREREKTMREGKAQGVTRHPRTSTAKRNASSFSIMTDPPFCRLCLLSVSTQFFSIIPWSLLFY